MPSLPRLSIASQALCDLRAARHRHRGAGAGGGRQRAPACGADRRIRVGLPGLAERRAHQRPDLRGGDGIARRLHVARTRRPRSTMPTACSSSTTRSPRSSTPGSARCGRERRRPVQADSPARIRAVHRIPQGAGAARRRGRPGRRPRMGRQRRQPHRPHRAEQGSRQARRALRQRSPRRSTPRSTPASTSPPG